MSNFKTYHKLDGFGARLQNKYMKLALETPPPTGTPSNFISSTSLVKALKGAQVCVQDPDNEDGKLYKTVKDAYICQYAGDEVEGKYSFLINVYFSNYKKINPPYTTMTDGTPSHRLCFIMPNADLALAYKQTLGMYTPNGIASSPFLASEITFTNLRNNKLGRILSFFEEPVIGNPAREFCASMYLENINLPLTIGAQQNTFYTINSSGNFVEDAELYYQYSCTVQSASSVGVTPSSKHFYLSQTDYIDTMFDDQPGNPETERFLQIIQINPIDRHHISISEGDYSIMVVS